jgi:hypothetical protein
MIKVNKSIRDRFTKNAEPDFRFTSGFVFPDNLNRSIQVLMNLSSAKKYFQAPWKALRKSKTCKILISRRNNTIQPRVIYFTLIFHTVCPS